MEFASANPSVVRSIKQRVLLNAWLRALQTPRSLPAIADFRPEGLADELPDMMEFEVRGTAESARFFIVQEGLRLAAAYGRDDLDHSERVNRYLDVTIDQELYARVVPCYRTCIARKRPTYSIASVRDLDGKQVSFERLLPFGSAGHVERIVGSYKAISVEGGFKVKNLMGLRADAHHPVRQLNAVIDLELARRPTGVRVCEDIVEAD
jgi:hypothetical protein